MEDIIQSLLKNRDLLLDIKQQDYEHFKTMEKNQGAIKSKMNTISNKVIILLLLVGIILGINICYYKDMVLEYLQPIVDIIKAVMKIGDS